MTREVSGARSGGVSMMRMRMSMQMRMLLIMVAWMGTHVASSSVPAPITLYHASITPLSPMHCFYRPHSQAYHVPLVTSLVGGVYKHEALIMQIDCLTTDVKFGPLSSTHRIRVVQNGIQVVDRECYNTPFNFTAQLPSPRPTSLADQTTILEVSIPSPCGATQTYDFILSRLGTSGRYTPLTAGHQCVGKASYNVAPNTTAQFDCPPPITTPAPVTTSAPLTTDAPRSSCGSPIHVKDSDRFWHSYCNPPGGGSYRLVNKAGSIDTWEFEEGSECTIGCDWNENTNPAYNMWYFNGTDGLQTTCVAGQWTPAPSCVLRFPECTGGTYNPTTDACDDCPPSGRGDPYPECACYTDEAIAHALITPSLITKLTNPTTTTTTATTTTRTSESEWMKNSYLLALPRASLPDTLDVDGAPYIHCTPSASESSDVCHLRMLSLPLKHLNAGDYILAYSGEGVLMLEEISIMPHPHGDVQMRDILTFTYDDSAGTLTTVKVTPDHMIITADTTTTTTTDTTTSAKSIVGSSLSYVSDGMADFFGVRGSLSMFHMKPAYQLRVGDMIWHQPMPKHSNSTAHGMADMVTMSVELPPPISVVIRSITTAKEWAVIQVPFLRHHRPLLDGTVASMWPEQISDIWHALHYYAYPILYMYPMAAQYMLDGMREWIRMRRSASAEQMHERVGQTEVKLKRLLNTIRQAWQYAQQASMAMVAIIIIKYVMSSAVVTNSIKRVQVLGAPFTSASITRQQA